MTTTATQQHRNEAVKAFNVHGSHPRFASEVIKGLDKVNEIIKHQLIFSKDLRNVVFIEHQFLLRHYYKQLIKLMK